MSGSEASLSTLAFAWRLERDDGVALGLTSHDRDLVFDGMRYRCSPGLVPSAIEYGAADGEGAVELAGALTSEALCAEDFRGGRWDGASLKLYLLDWEAPQDSPRLLLSGMLGAVEFSGEAFTVSLDGLARALERSVIETTSAECRASLGDPRCGVDLADRRRWISVVAADAGRIDVAESLGGEGRYAFGRLLWFDGANAGLRQMVITSADTGLTLREPPSYPVNPGDRAELIEGCDGRFETCRKRFDNALNFRGEPHLPGNDLLSRYAS